MKQDISLIYIYIYIEEINIFFFFLENALFRDTRRANCLTTPSLPLWFLSRDRDTIRPRIQRDVRATKTYSIILLSALISSRQLIEKKRDGRKRNPFISRACTPPPTLVCYSRLCPPFDPSPVSANVFSCRRIAANRRPLAAAWKLLEARPSSEWAAISKPRLNFSTFYHLALISNRFHFSLRDNEKTRKSRVVRVQEVRWISRTRRATDRQLTYLTYISRISFVETSLLLSFFERT